jgi:1,4-alpha-glucan branching enzyme
LTKGYFAFVLHSHLPYVISHGRWPHGTDWLCEAAAETYLPILEVLNELIKEKTSPKITIGLSPVLCEQLGDNQFKKEFINYVRQKVDAAENDIKEFTKTGQSGMLANAEFWRDWYNSQLKHFDLINQDIISEFKRLQDRHVVEIITCGATHGYYPLLSRDESLQVQTKLAVKNYEKHFGQKPQGIWLPECAYRPRYEWMPPVSINGDQKASLRKGVDEFLSENGIEFFIIDSALLRGGKSIGAYRDRFEALQLIFEQYAKSYPERPEQADKTPREVYLVASKPGLEKPVAIFTRDPDTGLLVWSGEHGYPGDGNYLDFHKKKFPGGHRYWAVTSAKVDLADKVEYNRNSALNRIPENAAHFAGKVNEILLDYYNSSRKAGILVSPYDAELFGHWWFEGPLFLKQVLKNISLNPNIQTTFLSDYLEKTKPAKVVSIPEGSWGEGNHHYIWLNDQNSWTWQYIYESEAKMSELARLWEKSPNKRDLELKQILEQMGRELLLMSASDWQFLISTKAAKDYAEMRLVNHYQDFKKLAKIAEKKSASQELSPNEHSFLKECQARDALFPELDLKWFSEVQYPAVSD